MKKTEENGDAQEPNSTVAEPSAQAQPPQDAEQEKELIFELGLVMAGAVSAGAYTAGVIDFLMEALEAWETAKESEKECPTAQKTIPYHKVRIKVISGASAGGMTGAMMAAMIRNKACSNNPTPDLIRNSWVNEIDIEHLLKDNDLKHHQEGLRSILDSTEIETIAKKAYAFKPADHAWQPIPYVHDKLKLFLTLSNLRGIPYEFDIAGETGFKYGMANFADYEEATINSETTSGQWNRIKQAAVATGAFPVGLSARLIQRDPIVYFERSRQSGKDYISLKLSRQGTYTFTCVDGGMLNNEPLGLAFEELYRCAPTKEVVMRVCNAVAREKREQQSEEKENGAAAKQDFRRASDKASVQAQHAVPMAVAVENGGCKNSNTPSDNASSAIEQEIQKVKKSFDQDPEALIKSRDCGRCKERDRTVQENADYALYKQTLDRALLLIDPFPNIIEVSSKNDQEDSLGILKVIPRLISCLIRQASFKPEELLAAAHKNIYSSFMISPIRYNDVEQKEEYPIASGFLGGFGGFFLKEFRQHDYELGRRNCQRFLERYFVVPAAEFKTNPIFSGANGKLLSQYQVVEKYTEDCEEKQRVYYPIIPLLGDRASQDKEYTFTNCAGKEVSVQNMQQIEEAPVWPGYKPAHFSKLTSKVRRRTNLIINRFLDESIVGRLLRASPWLFVLLLLADAGFYASFIRGTVMDGSNVLHSSGFAALLFVSGIVGMVALIYLLLKWYVLNKIKAVLREQLESYQFKK